MSFPYQIPESQDLFTGILTSCRCFVGTLPKGLFEMRNLNTFLRIHISNNINGIIYKI